MQIIIPRTGEEFRRYYDLRWRVLRQPWDQPPGTERDALETESIHLMACRGATLLGVGRLHFNSRDEAQIRFMAVEEAQRGGGVGRLLLQSLEGHARAGSARRIILDARESAAGFYAAHGYAAVATAHTLFGLIPHTRMAKDL
ncbi:MAG: hypothetical protein B7Z66_10805 [Chromatiales bacterium 21-64-14]|nr:MAG: hypothetical protein B7Z66_10805 [Chromatiales bacterium 21-64-14]HQU15625.1 GNAT family N-acetyltransferase [Gammaproteobacteria bacterium]